MFRYPPIFQTIIRIFKFWGTTYVSILPFLLLSVISELILSETLTTTVINYKDKINLNEIIKTINLSNALSLDVILILAYIIINLIIYCACLFYMNNLYHQKPSACSYAQALVIAVKRIPSIILAIIYLLVIFSIFYLITLAMTLTSDSHAVGIFMVFAMIGLSFYFFATFFFIICQSNGAWASIKKSCSLISGYWIETFFILLIITIYSKVLNFIIVSVFDYKYVGFLIGQLLLFSLSIAVLVVHANQLFEIHQKKIKSTQEKYKMETLAT